LNKRISSGLICERLFSLVFKRLEASFSRVVHSTIAASNLLARFLPAKCDSKNTTELAIVVGISHFHGFPPAAPPLQIFPPPAAYSLTGKVGSSRDQVDIIGINL
jgi:hypothetical protein